VGSARPWNDIRCPDPSGVEFMQDFFEEWASFHLIGGRRFKLIKVHLPESSAREVHSNRQAAGILAIELTTAFA
jgi:hypothetical protein